MIAFLSGQIQSMQENNVVIDVSGVGYKVHMPASEITGLGKIGDKTGLHIHTHVREDALILFGFVEEQSISMFELLISVSGIGPKLALTMLSSMSAQILQVILSDGDHVSLTRIPGIGKKTSQRIILELKDKSKKLPMASAVSKNNASLLGDLSSAISNLGYRPKEIQKALKAIEPSIKADKSLTDLLTEALQHIQ